MNRLARDNRKVADHGFGFNALVGFDVTDRDVDTLAAQLVPAIEHRVGFSRAGCSPEINRQLPVTDAHPIAQCSRERRRERRALDVRLLGIQNGDVALDRRVDETRTEFPSRQDQQRGTIIRKVDALRLGGRQHFGIEFGCNADDVGLIAGWVGKKLECQIYAAASGAQRRTNLSQSTPLGTIVKAVEVVAAETVGIVN